MGKGNQVRGDQSGLIDEKNRRQISLKRKS
jgi:hypothetical protein